MSTKFVAKLVWQQNFFKTFLTNSWWNCFFFFSAPFSRRRSFVDDCFTFVSSMAVGNMEMPHLNGKNIVHDAQILRRISAPLPTYSSSTKCLPTWSSNEWSNHWTVFSTRSTTRSSFKPKNGTTYSDNKSLFGQKGSGCISSYFSTTFATGTCTVGSFVDKIFQTNCFGLYGTFITIK